jgi:hypothetical protein
LGGDGHQLSDFRHARGGRDAQIGSPPQFRFGVISCKLSVGTLTSRSVGKFRTEDQMASSILDASSDDPVLVLRMGIGLEARE